IILGTFQMIFQFAYDVSLMIVTSDDGILGLLVLDQYSLVPPTGPGFDATPAIDCFWVYDHRRDPDDPHDPALSALFEMAVEDCAGLGFKTGALFMSSNRDFDLFVDAMREEGLERDTEVPMMYPHFSPSMHAKLRPYMHWALVLPWFPWAPQLSIP
ncbi:hypothetical protein H9P43_003628, partial [Blastocladiella emersonii ATCC 22665]